MFKTITGYQTFEETRKSLVHYAKTILTTSMDKNVLDGLHFLKIRIRGLKALVKLLDAYVDQLETTIKKNSEYVKDGKKYRKLFRSEEIEDGAMQSWCNGELQPIMNTDGETIGGRPIHFSEERDFYNPI